MPGRPGYAGQVCRKFRQLSHRTTGKKIAVVGLDDNCDIFFLGRIHLGAGSDGQARPGYARQECVGRAIKRGWGEPSNEVGRATHWASQLGEPVLSRWASPYSLGEPVLVGRATKPLGEPSNEVGRASHWASQLGEPVLSGQRLLGATVPARHV